MIRRTFVLAAVAAALLAAPGPAAAQSFGIGPRLSFVRGDIASSTPDAGFMGGTIRMRSSPNVALELAMDYRSRFNDDGTLRVREVPVQASVLVFLTRSTFRPYVLGGFGAYNELTDEITVTGEAVTTSSSRRTGIHLGVGAEFFTSRHSALFVDYRFRFVKFGGAGEDDEPIEIPGFGRTSLTHRGSMWTSGVAFYF